MIGVAILGAGIGAQHVDGLLALPDRFRVRTICDLDEARARDLARRAESVAVTRDIDAVLSDPGVDLVDICLPPSLHAPVAIRALEAGKDVVVEKPLALDPAEADRVVKAARRTGRSVFPVFQYRFGRAARALQALIGAGLAGAPRAGAIETHWDRGPDYYANGWRGTLAAEGGGAVLIHAIHMHDLMTLFLGQVEAVQAMTGTLVNPIETEDTAAIAFRLAGGALVTSSITLGAAGNTTRLRFVFEHLTAESGDAPYAPTEADWRFIARDPARQPDVEATLAGLPPVRTGFAGFFAEIAAALAGEPASPATLDDAVASLRLAQAIYRSAGTGREVRLAAPGAPAARE